MEEKLYFSPANYGKGAKRKQEKPAKDHRARKLVIFLLFLIIIILIILWLLRGRTTISGQYPENVKNESLVCSSNSLIPPKMTYLDSSEKEVKISAIFRGGTELKSLFLVYSLAFESGDAAYAAEAKSHAKFNESLYTLNYKVDKFDNKFARYENNLSITLNISKSELDEASAPFFMLTPDDHLKITQETLSDFKQIYEAQGFKCESTI